MKIADRTRIRNFWDVVSPTKDRGSPTVEHGMIDRVIRPSPEPVIHFAVCPQEPTSCNSCSVKSEGEGRFANAVLCPQHALFKLVALRTVGFLCGIGRNDFRLFSEG